MELTDIMPKEKWIELQEELHDRFKLNADVMDKEGKRLAGNTWGNDLCKRIREDAKGFGAICAPSGQAFTQMVQAGEKFAEECDACMLRISVPIKKDGELLGAVGGCGLVPEDGEVEEFFIGMSTDMDEATIEKLAAEVPVASEAHVQAIFDYIESRLAEILA